jgi:hypothetical protein
MSFPFSRNLTPAQAALRLQARLLTLLLNGIASADINFTACMSISSRTVYNYCRTCTVKSPSLADSAPNARVKPDVGLTRDAATAHYTSGCCLAEIVALFFHSCDRLHRHFPARQRPLLSLHLLKNSPLRRPWGGGRTARSASAWIRHWHN